MTLKRRIAVSVISISITMFPLVANGKNAAVKKHHEALPNDAFDKKMELILQSYLEIHKSLVSESTKNISNSAKDIFTKAVDLEKINSSSEFKKIPSDIKSAAKALESTKTTGEARKHFGKLSKAMKTWAEAAKPSGVYIMYCSMVEENWLQKTTQIQNPYGGKNMINCGEIVSKKG